MKILFFAFMGIFLLINICPAQELDSLDFYRKNQGHVYDLPTAFQAQIPGLLMARPGSNPNEQFSMLYRGFNTYQLRMEPLMLFRGMPGVPWQLLDPFFIDSLAIRSGAGLSQWGMQGAAGIFEAGRIKPRNPGLHLRAQQGIVLERHQRAHPTMSAADLRGQSLPDGYFIGSRDTDWLREITQTAFSSHTGVQLDFQNENLDVFAGLSHRMVNGIQKQTGFNQLSFSGGLDYHLLNDRIKIGGSAYLVDRQSDLGFVEFFEAAVAMNPTLGRQDEINNFNLYGGNPYLRLQEDGNSLRTGFSLWEGHMEARPIENWLIQARYGLTRHTRNHELDLASADRKNLSLRERNINRQDDRSLLELSTAYDFEIKEEIQIKPYLRYAYQELSYDQSGFQRLRNFDNPGSLIEESLRPEFEKYAYLSMGGGVDFSIKKIRAQAYFQREQANHLGENAGWGNFYGFNYFHQLSENLAFKTSFSKTGMAPDQSGLSQAVFDTEPVLFFRHYANPNLKWEETRQFDIGLESRHFKGKLISDLKAFISNSSDFIALLPSSTPSPGSYNYQNFGAIQNTGLEWWLHFRPSPKGKLRYQTSFNFTTLRSKWADLTAEEVDLEGRDVGVSRGIGGNPYFRYNTLQLNQAIGTVNTLQYIGINSQTGSWIVDQSNQDDFTQNYVAQGRGIPRWWIGINQQVAWSKWRIDAFFRGVFGHVNVDEADLRYGSDRDLVSNIVTSTYQERRDAGLRDFNFLNSFFVHNSSFLSLQYLSIGRDLKIGSGKWNSHLAFIANNLFYLTAFPSGDPEARISSMAFWLQNEPLEARPFYFSPGVASASTWLPSRSFMLQYSINF